MSALGVYIYLAYLQPPSTSFTINFPSSILTYDVRTSSPFLYDLSAPGIITTYPFNSQTVSKLQFSAIPEINSVSLLTMN